LAILQVLRRLSTFSTGQGIVGRVKPCVVEVRGKGKKTLSRKKKKMEHSKACHGPGNDNQQTTQLRQ